MSHYNDFEYILRERDEEQRSFTMNKYERELEEESLAEEAQNAREEEDARSRDNNELYDEYSKSMKTGVSKHKEGKIAGARYFFLVELVDSGATRLAHSIETLVYSDCIVKSVDCIKDAVKQLLTYPSALDDAIKIRAQAVESGKYRADSYKTLGLEDATDILDALARHFIKLACHEEIDEDSGYRHTGHILNNMLILKHIYRVV